MKKRHTPLPQVNSFVVFLSYFQSLGHLVVAGLLRTDGTVTVIWIALVNQGSMETDVCCSYPTDNSNCNFPLEGNELQTLWMLFRQCYQVSAELKRQGSCYPA